MLLGYVILVYSHTDAAAVAAAALCVSFNEKSKKTSSKMFSHTVVSCLMLMILMTHVTASPVTGSSNMTDFLQSTTQESINQTTSVDASSTTGDIRANSSTTTSTTSTTSPPHTVSTASSTTSTTSPPHTVSTTTSTTSTTSPPRTASTATSTTSTTSPPRTVSTATSTTSTPTSLNTNSAATTPTSMENLENITSMHSISTTTGTLQVDNSTTTTTTTTTTITTSLSTGGYTCASGNASTYQNVKCAEGCFGLLVNQVPSIGCLTSLRVADYGFGAIAGCEQNQIDGYCINYENAVNCIKCCKAENCNQKYNSTCDFTPQAPTCAACSFGVTSLVLLSTALFLLQLVDIV